MDYDINTELGPMHNIAADSVEAAKAIYSAAHRGYDFEGAQNGEYPGSWFFINCDGVRVEDFTADMPN
jgi:hypothetical protein